MLTCQAHRASQPSFFWSDFARELIQFNSMGVIFNLSHKSILYTNVVEYGNSIFNPDLLNVDRRFDIA